MLVNDGGFLARESGAAERVGEFVFNSCMPSGVEVAR